MVECTRSRGDGRRVGCGHRLPGRIGEFHIPAKDPELPGLVVGNGEHRIDETAVPGDGCRGLKALAG